MGVKGLVTKNGIATHTVVDRVSAHPHNVLILVKRKGWALTRAVGAYTSKLCLA